MFGSKLPESARNPVFYGVRWFSRKEVTGVLVLEQRGESEAVLQLVEGSSGHGHADPRCKSVKASVGLDGTQTQLMKSPLSVRPFL